MCFTFWRVLTLFMTDTSSFTVEDLPIVSVWFHEKCRRGQTNDAMKAKFLSRFNKSADTEDDRRKLEKQERQCTYNVTVRRVRATILLWKNNEYYTT